MSDPFVVDRSEVETFSPPHHEDATSVELVNPERGSDQVTFRISTVDPGGSDGWHAHDGSQQLMYVLSGEATLWLGEPGNDDQDDAAVHDLTPETFVFIPETAYHQLQVPEGGDSLDLIVIWVPPYESLEEWAPENN